MRAQASVDIKVACHTVHCTEGCHLFITGIQSSLNMMNEVKLLEELVG